MQLEIAMIMNGMNSNITVIMIQSNKPTFVRKKRGGGLRVVTRGNLPDRERAVDNGQTQWRHDHHHNYHGYLRNIQW